VRNLLCNVRRILHWLPILWRDRWWDSCFLLEVMAAKLRYDAARYTKSGCHVGNERRAKQMHTAAALCERLSQQEYTSPWDAEETAAGNRFWDYMSSNERHMGSLIYYSSEGYVKDRRLSQAADWARERHDAMRDQDLEYLFRLFQKHLFSWWD
jgi:hypothetical protein